MISVTQEYVDEIRALDESGLVRSYRRFHWDEEGSDWLVETVNDDGEEWIVKQLVVESDGTTHRYWWGHVDDEAGGLGDQALDPSVPGIEAIDAQDVLRAVAKGELISSVRGVLPHAGAAQRYECWRLG